MVATVILVDKLLVVEFEEHGEVHLFSTECVESASLQEVGGDVEVYINNEHELVLVKLVQPVMQPDPTSKLSLYVQDCHLCALVASEILLDHHFDLEGVWTLEQDYCECCVLPQLQYCPLVLLEEMLQTCAQS